VKSFAGDTEKINAAYAYGGDGLAGDRARAKSVELLAQTIKDQFGVAFDAAAIVDFNGSGRWGGPGGVDMHVDRDH
jgi:anionic cell wall polymer biosynthesis LytR-Cps2A-Psr (LCP) family protein